MVKALYKHLYLEKLEVHKTNKLSMHALENSFFPQIIHSHVKNRILFVLKCRFYFCLGMMRSIGQGRTAKQITNKKCFIYYSQLPRREPHIGKVMQENSLTREL